MGRKSDIVRVVVVICVMFLLYFHLPMEFDTKPIEVDKRRAQRIEVDGKNEHTEMDPNQMRTEFDNQIEQTDLDNETIRLEVEQYERITHEKGNTSYAKNGEMMTQTCDYSRRPSASDIGSSKAGDWQEYRYPSGRTFMYSAHYDDRISTKPALRIALISHNLPDKMYCQVWYPDVVTGSWVVAKVMRNAYPKRQAGVVYNQYLCSCELPDLRVPAAVSITTAPCQNTTHLLPVQVPPRDHQHEFGICVKFGFGDLYTPALIIEWLELNRILGVTEFNIYNGSMPGKLRPVFSYYEEMGLLNVHSISLVIDANNTLANLTNDVVSLNDCLYRNMYRYRYLIVVDLDEVITPHQHHDLHHMMRNLTSHYPTATSFSFRQTIFLKQLAQDESQPEYLMTLRLRLRTPHFSPGAVPKSIHDPRRCLSMWLHACWKGLEGYSKKVVSPDIGLSHHYRLCKKVPQNNCSKLVEESFRDDIMLQFKQTLNDKVSHTMNVLKAQSTQ